MTKAFILSIFLAMVVTLIIGNSLFAAEGTLRIPMILWRGQTKAEEGFKDGLKELGYSVKYRIMDARQNRKKLRSLLKNEIAPKLNDFDYIYTFGTTVSKMTKTIVRNRIPQLFNIVADPVESGIVQSIEKTGSNISGGTHIIPVSLQIEAALKIMQFKRLGLFFNPREHNSMIQRRRLYEIARNLHFKVVDLRSPPALDMLRGNLQKLIDKSIVVDAVYLPSDSFLISSAKLIGSRLRFAGVKSIGSVKTFIENGALIGIVPDYYKMGKAVATIVDRHQKGEKLHDIPVVEGYQVHDPIMMINRTTSRLLNVNFHHSLSKNVIIVD